MPRADSGGVGIAYEIHGDDGGRPVLLLHGFPDTGRCWRNQVPALTNAGYRVIVPDLRGYGASDKPEDVDAYNLLVLGGDVAAVLDDAGVAKAHVVGHDWGAALTWVVATFLADRVDHAVAMSVGHPSVFLTAGGMLQREKSWYMLFFQYEGIAESWLRDDGWAGMREWGRHPDGEAVLADLEANDSLTPGLNWYRANITPEAFAGARLELPPVPVPVMGVWSSSDFALTEVQMQASGSQCGAGFRYERVDGAGHWMQLEAPDRVNELLLDFLPR
jgi:pimeloyl-ACP methyl ester carboxylesterase